MKYINYIIVLIIIFCISTSSHSQESEPIFPEYFEQEALDSLVKHYKPSQVLNYSNARDYLYGTVYNENDTVKCVYSGHQLYLPSGVDPSIHLYQDGSNDGINCEHTFPRSKGASEDNGNAYSDMHHLFPTRSQVNSGRENFPYAEINDEESTHWYYQNEVKSDMPFNNINLYSERINGWFEPREDHKGNTARAMFYFYTMYKAEADNADLNFFDVQKKTLCQWHHDDIVDENELNRTKLIADKQNGLGNPFVLDQGLADRCYCSEFTTSVNDDELDEGSSMVNVYPNPVRSSQAITFESSLDQELEVVFYSLIGSRLSNEIFHIHRGENKMKLPELAAGSYFYSVIDNSKQLLIKKGIVSVL